MAHISLVKLYHRVLKALDRHDMLLAAEPSENVTCDLVNNVQWWADNGFSEAERRAMGHDLGCPGYEN